MIIKNQLIDFNRLSDYLRSFDSEVTIGIEPTADYHRNLAHFLLQNFNVRFLSSISVARTREALHNSWDKNDPKDAQVILHLMKTGITQYFYDPVVEGTNDIQAGNTHFQISLRKVKLQHSLLNHYLLPSTFLKLRLFCAQQGLAGLPSFSIIFHFLYGHYISKR